MNDLETTSMTHGELWFQVLRLTKRLEETEKQLTDARTALLESPVVAGKQMSTVYAMEWVTKHLPTIEAARGVMLPNDRACGAYRDDDDIATIRLLAEALLDVLDNAWIDVPTMEALKQQHRAAICAAMKVVPIAEER
jgi:hypothetical protein